MIINKKKLIKKMHRCICLLLGFVLLLSVAGCSKNNADETSGKEAKVTGFRVGYGKADITAKESVPLAGSSNTLTRMSTGFDSYLYTMCVAVSDENNNTVLFMTYDLLIMSESLAESIRTEIYKELGIPKENIICSASHVHSAPDLTQTSLASISRYRSLVIQQSVAAAQAAVADQANAEMKIASAQTENMNFVRRYILENGTAAGDNYGDFDSSPIARHESEADGELQLIKFERSDKKDIIMTNFQAHPSRATADSEADRFDMTSDVVGAYRDAMEEQLDCHSVYWTGASGNTNLTSRIESENVVSTYKEQGKVLADYAIKAEDSYEKVNTGTVAVKQIVYKAPVDHSQDALLDLATDIKKVWYSTNNFKKAKDMCAGTGISSPNHAQAIILKAGLDETINVELNAITIGDVAFATAPFEFFSQLGQMVKESSPYDMTFMLCYTNGSLGYCPSEDVWDNGGYEVDVCKLYKGGGEVLAQQLVDMLKEVNGGK